MIKLDKDDKLVLICKCKTKPETTKIKKNNERKSANSHRNKQRDN